MTKVSEAQIIPIKPQNGLVAFASCVVDDKLYIGSIGIYTKLNGGSYRLTYPTKKIGDKSINLVHPITQEAGKAIEEAIIKKVNELFYESQQGRTIS